MHPRTSANPNLWTFARHDDGDLAGTITVRLDTPTASTPTDLCYRRARYVRIRSSIVAEQAVHTAWPSAPRGARSRCSPTLHTVYLFAWGVRNFDYVVIEVNPRHVGFYEDRSASTSSDTHAAQPPRRCARGVDGMSFKDIAITCIVHNEHGAAPERAESSYAYGFSPTEEAACSAGCGAGGGSDIPIELASRKQARVEKQLQGRPLAMQGLMQERPLLIIVDHRACGAMRAHGRRDRFTHRRSPLTGARTRRPSPRESRQRMQLAALG
jgi:hypothetical protein